MTLSRRMVIDSLFAASAPVTAEELSRGLQLELTSVYRTLERLEELGVVHHMHFGHGAGLYALRRAGGAHEYLYCEICGTVTTLETAQLDDFRRDLREAHGFVARFDHFPMMGVCAACAGAPPTS